jgi:hypothetical protein
MRSARAIISLFVVTGETPHGVFETGPKPCYEVGFISCVTWRDASLRVDTDQQVR